jgi:hypothetical protein
MMVDLKFTPVWVPAETDKATMITSGGLSDAHIDSLVKEYQNTEISGMNFSGF